MALTVFPSGSARAQVEFRCPAGWSRADNVQTPRTAAPPNVREAVGHCFGGKGSTIDIEVDFLLAPAPSEVDWLRQRQPPIPASTSFRDEAVPGLAKPARALEWEHLKPAVGHHGEMTSYGRLAIVRLAGALVTVASQDTVGGRFSWTAPENAAAAEKHRGVFRAFIAAMVGLDGFEASWHAQAACPAGTSPTGDAEALQLVRGWRRIVRCRSNDGLVDVEVRESRIPVPDAAAARREAALASQILPWASEEPVATLLKSLHAVKLGAQPATVGSLAWPVLRDMGRDNRPRRARFAWAVLPTTLGNVQVGWLARDATAAAADKSLRAFLATLTP